MIEGVKTKQLKIHADERGRLMEVFRSDDELFEKFGQVYITTAYPGVVKAWHFHRIQADNLTVISGMAKVALYDSRSGSPTKGEINEFYVGQYIPLLVHIPPKVWHGFKATAKEAIIVNCPTEPYNHENPDEYRIDPHDGGIPYPWGRKDG